MHFKKFFESTIIAYHGSPISGLSSIRYESSPHLRVSGIYFTKNKKIAEKYTKVGGKINPSNIHTAEITMKNPADRSILDKLGYKLNGIDMRNELIRLGYDGVIDDYMDEVIVFYPNQINLKT